MLMGGVTSIPSLFVRAWSVADVTPNPPRAGLVREAEALGCIALDGLGMLVSQGVISIRYSTDVDAGPTLLRRWVEDLFGL
jgi:shikimate 5-dehydrogenase